MLSSLTPRALFFTCLLFVLPSLIFAQRAYSVEILAGPQLTHAWAHNADDTDGQSYVFGDRGDGFAAGLYLRKNFGKFFVRSGLTYDRSAFNHGAVYVPTTGSDPGNSIATRSEESTSIVSLGIPLEVGYAINTGCDKLHLEIGGGLMLTRTIDYKSLETYYVMEEISSEFGLNTNPNRRTQLNYLLSTGIVYDLGEHTSLSLEPRVSYVRNQLPETPFLVENERGLSSFRTMLGVRLRTDLGR